jgi:hypothetical protein
VVVAGGYASSFGAGAVGGALEGLGALGAFLGVVVVLLAIGMFVSPDHHLGCGIGILVLSLISLVSGGGFFLGLILGLVGGILGIVFHPTEELDGEGLFPAGGGRRCRHCGQSVASAGSRYCPACGQPM